MAATSDPDCLRDESIGRPDTRESGRFASLTVGSAVRVVPLGVALSVRVQYRTTAAKRLAPMDHLYRALAGFYCSPTHGIRPGLASRLTF